MAAYGQPPPHPHQHPPGPPPPYAWASPYPYGMPPPHPMWPNPYAQQHMDPRMRDPAFMELRNEREDASGRWVLEPEDVLLLERVFALEKCPGRELRMQLAQRLHVKPRQVQVWFQNKRQRTKNGAKPTVAEALAHAAVANAQENRTRAEPGAQLLMSIANSGDEAAPAAAPGAPEAPADAKDTPADAEATPAVGAAVGGGEAAQPSAVANPMPNGVVPNGSDRAVRTGLTRVPQTLVVSPSAAEVAASTLAAATAGLPPHQQSSRFGPRTVLDAILAQPPPPPTNSRPVPSSDPISAAEATKRAQTNHELAQLVIHGIDAPRSVIAVSHTPSCPHAHMPTHPHAHTPTCGPPLLTSTILPHRALAHSRTALRLRSLRQPKSLPLPRR